MSTPAHIVPEWYCVFGKIIFGDGEPIYGVKVSSRRRRVASRPSGAARPDAGASSDPRCERNLQTHKQHCSSELSQDCSLIAELLSLREMVRMARRYQQLAMPERAPTSRGLQALRWMQARAQNPIEQLPPEILDTIWPRSARISNLRIARLRLRKILGSL